MSEPIIVTGLSGYIGTRVRQLLGKKYALIDFSRKSGVDLTNYRELRAALAQYPKARLVVHLAAFTDTQQAWEQRGDKKGDCYQINVVGTRNLVAALQKRKKRVYLILFSTDFVFSGEKEGVYTEEDKPDPIEWYGYTKYLAEKIVIGSGFKAAVVRIAFPYQASSPVKKDLVARIREKLSCGNLYPMFTDQTITPTFVDDIVQSLPTFWQKQPVGIFHLVGSPHSPFQVARLIAQTFGFDPNLVSPGSLAKYLAAQPPGSRPWQKNLALSNQKVFTQLGIRMHTLSEGLAIIKNQLQGGKQ